MNYKIGDEVELTINGIKEYGVFGTTEDEVIGLIYIANVRKEYILDLERYFRIGDHVKGKVIEIKDNRLSVSVLNYPLPDYDKQIVLPAEVKEEFNEQEVIYSYMKKIIGDLSESASRKMNELIRQHGIAKIAIELGRKTNFSPDLGLILAEEIEKDLRDPL